MSVRHNLAMVEGSGALFVAGKITGATGVLSQLFGPLSQQGDITCVRSGVGLYTLTINPFLGPLGVANPQLEAITLDHTLHVNSITYTGTSLAISITGRSASANADTDMYFQIMAN